MSSSLRWACLLLCAWGCGSARPSDDAGIDSGRADLGGDAARVDVGPNDLGVDASVDLGPDLGAGDLGASDLGLVDLGMDDGVVDLGADLGPPDAGRPLCVAGMLRAPDAHWAVAPIGAGIQQLFAVATGPDGSVVAVGRNRGTVNFGDGAHTASGVDGVLVVKMDPTGHVAWSREYDDSRGDSEPHAVDVDASGNVIFGGYFTGTIDFGGGARTAAGAAREIFVAKLDVGGNWLWDRQYGVGVVYGIAAYPSGIAITGEFSLTSDFGDGAPRTSNGQSDVFLVRTDASGTTTAAHQFGGPRVDYAAAIDADAAGSLVLVGETYGDIDFGGGPVWTAPTTTSPGSFGARLDATDAHVWSYGFAGGELTGVAFVDGAAVAIAGTDYLSVREPGGAERYAHTFTLPDSAYMPSVVAAGAGAFWLEGEIYPAGCARTSSAFIMASKLSATTDTLLDLRSARGTFLDNPSLASVPSGEVTVAGAYASSIDVGVGALGPPVSLDAFMTLLQ